MATVVALPAFLCTSCLRMANRAAARVLIKPQPAISLRVQRAYLTQKANATWPQQQSHLASAPASADSNPQYTLKAHRLPTLPPVSHLERTLATTTDLSSAKPAHAIENPRTDDSGKPMLISISPRASARLHKISISEQNPNLALRVSVESGGCHGFQYIMDLTDLSKMPATEEDTIFEGERGEKVVIDESSLELLNGSTVDYTMELIGSQFKVTGIPGATSSCGCGTSFDIQL